MNIYYYFVLWEHLMKYTLHIVVLVTREMKSTWTILKNISIVTYYYTTGVDLRNLNIINTN